MQHPQHHYAILLHEIEDGIGESRNNRAPHRAMHGSEHLGIALDRLKHRAAASEESLAKAWLSRLVILESCGEIAPDPVPKDDPQRH